MGVYNRAEFCELVGSYLLYKLSKLCDKKDIGLYRDNGLAVFNNKSRPHIETSAHSCHMIAKTKAEFPFKVSTK